jgi:hypothetical protein
MLVYQRVKPNKHVDLNGMCTQRMSCRKIKASPPQRPTRAPTELEVDLALGMGMKNRKIIGTFQGKYWEHVVTSIPKGGFNGEKHGKIMGKCGKPWENHGKTGYWMFKTGKNT